MNHRHFKTIPSTQEYLIENIKDFSGEVLITCDEQTQGRGQYSRSWDDYPETLCMSFLISPNPTLTLTSLEVGVLIQKFFNKKLKLKWPNDILTNESHKCAGILLNNTDGKIIVGIGINLFPAASKSDYRTPMGSVFSEIHPIDKTELAIELYQFILDNRLSPKETQKQWNQNCLHLDKVITLVEGEKESKGIFKGIGDHGEALIEMDNKLHQLYSGSIIL